MITPRQRDTTAESPDWNHLDDFYIGIGRGDRVRLSVFRHATDSALHRLVADEMTRAGPRLIAVFTEPATETATEPSAKPTTNPTAEPTSDPTADHEEWHPAWQSDPMRATVEAQARIIARK